MSIYRESIIKFVTESILSDYKDRLLSIEDIVTKTVFLLETKDSIEDKTDSSRNIVDRRFNGDAYKAIDKDTITCLECGHVGKLLNGKHLANHGMTTREYKMKWGYPLAQPLSSKNLTRRRKRIAIEGGAGHGLKQWRERQNDLHEN